MALFRTTPGVARSLPTQRADLSFGLASEEDSLETLQSFLGTTLRRKGGYAVMDFENPDRTVFCELKSRRIRHDQHPTAIIGANKVAWAASKPGEHWFAFCYVDGLYVIKYDTELFATFETDENYYRGDRADCQNKAQSIYYIPVEHLTKVN
jgi:hypothetical protein